VLARFDGPVVCSVRDLFLACPNHSLLYLNHQACGIPEDLSLCAKCLPETKHLDIDELVEFRAQMARSIEAVDTWVFASQSAADYLLRAYDIEPDRIRIITHGAVIPTTRHQPVDEDLVLHEPLRVAFVGRGWSKKGLDTVNWLADQLTDTPIEIHHFGELVEPASRSVRTHGTYDNQFLPDLLRLAGIHVVLLPGRYAETFGHVMTESLIAGLPIIGATYGALGERIRTHGVGWTIDPDDPPQLETLVRRLDTARFELLRATRRADELALRTVEETAGDYAALYSDRARRQAHERPGPGNQVLRGTSRENDVTDDSTAEVDRLRRQLRAMSSINRELQAELDVREPAPSAGALGRNLRRARRRTPPGVVRSVNALLLYLPPEVEHRVRRAVRRVS